MCCKNVCHYFICFCPENHLKWLFEAVEVFPSSDILWITWILCPAVVRSAESFSAPTPWVGSELLFCCQAPMCWMLHLSVPKFNFISCLFLVFLLENGSSSALATKVGYLHTLLWLAWTLMGLPNHTVSSWW